MVFDEAKHSELISKKHKRTESRGGRGADASRTDMGRKTGFSGLGLYGMRMGFQVFMAAGWQIHS